MFILFTHLFILLFVHSFIHLSTQTKSIYSLLCSFIHSFPDSCDWTSDCSDHVICFKNLTGCPVSGPHLITIETPCSSGSGCVQNGTGATPPDTSHSKSEIILVVVVILAAALIAIVFFSVRFHCYFRRLV